MVPEWDDQLGRKLGRRTGQLDIGKGRDSRLGDHVLEERGGQVR